MRPSLKDQASNNANKWAQQRKEQMERSRQSSRERTNFAAMGDMAVGGQRQPQPQPQPMQRLSSQERSRNPQTMPPQYPPMQDPRRATQPVSQGIRSNSGQKTMPPQAPQRQQVPDVQGSLRLLKSKMSNGQTNSRQQARDVDQNQRPTKQDNYRQQFTPSTDWDDTPTKGSYEAPTKAQPPKFGRTNSYQEEEPSYTSVKKPPMQQPKKTISYEEPRQQRGLPPRKGNKQPEYENYNSNPFGFENPHDDEPAVATGQAKLVQYNFQKPVPVYADPDEDTDLYECPEGCGRKFNENALNKHIKVCQKVFQQKRKAFNTKAHRVVNSEHAQLLRQAEQREKQESKPQQNKKVNDRPINGQKKAKWQAQSEAFRAILRQNKGVALTREESAAINEASDIGRVQCPHCNRKFNEEAGKRHITFCETKAKQAQFKQGPSKQVPQAQQNQRRR